MGDASALTGPAVVAGRAAVVAPGENGGPADREDALARPAPEQRLSHHPFRAAQLHGRQELAVRQLRQPFGLPAHADEALHVVVPRRDVRVANGPIDANLLPGVGLEVQAAPTVNLATPHDRTPASLAAADPGERLVCVEVIGVLAIVHEKLGSPLVARVALLLDGLVSVDHLPITATPEWQLPRLHG